MSGHNEEIVTYCDSASAGMLVMGSLRNAIEQCADMADVDVKCYVTNMILARKVEFVAKGTRANISRFQKLLSSIRTRRVFE